MERSLDTETRVYEYRAVGLAAPTIQQPANRASVLPGPSGGATDPLLSDSARLVLAPESVSLPVDWRGLAGALDVKTSIEVRVADKLDTPNWDLSVITPPGVRGVLIDRAWHLTRLDDDAGYADIVATSRHSTFVYNVRMRWAEKLWGSFRFAEVKETSVRVTAKGGQRPFGSFFFARGMQLRRRFYVSKIAPVGTDQIASFLPADPVFAENLSSGPFVEKLFSRYIKLQASGSIRGGDRYTENGTDTGQAVPGFWQGANGQLKIADGSIDLRDTLNRRIKISTTDGLKALDAQGKVIHDIPDQAIANGEYYMGHLVWWQDPGVTLVNTAITAAQTWYTQNIAKRSYTNIKGVILDMGCSYNPDANVAWGNTRVAFRPFGSALGPNDCFTPYVSFNLTGDYVDYLRSSMMIILPVGSNGGELAFQYWPVQELSLLVIGQRGVLI